MLKKVLPALNSPIAKVTKSVLTIGLTRILTSEQVNFEMARTEQAIQRLIGVQVAFTHPPYGEYNNNVRQVAANRNQKLVNWSFDSGDLIGAMPAESNAAYDKLVKDHPSSVLVLNHEVYSTFLFFSFDIR